MQTERRYERKKNAGNKKPRRRNSGSISATIGTIEAGERGEGGIVGTLYGSMAGDGDGGGGGGGGGGGDGSEIGFEANDGDFNGGVCRSNYSVVSIYESYINLSLSLSLVLLIVIFNFFLIMKIMIFYFWSK